MQRLRVVTFILAFIVVTTSLFQAKIAYANVNTDKSVYDFGEQIIVSFSNAPGNDSDWICIVPVGVKETDGGDYKYMPKGRDKGTLSFTVPAAPGKYEVRAYYNYNLNGYVVTARQTFTVGGDIDVYKKKLQEQMERKANPNYLQESRLPSDKGLVYLIREPWNFHISPTTKVQIIANNKPAIFLSTNDYYPLMVDPGEVVFSVGRIEYTNGNETTPLNCEKTTINVKPGYIYYLLVRVIYTSNTCSLVSTAYQEGAELINKYSSDLAEK